MEKSEARCLGCGRSSEQIPLLRLQYAKVEQWICPRCLPILIHKPERLPAVAGEWTSNSDRPADDE